MSRLSGPSDTPFYEEIRNPLWQLNDTALNACLALCREKSLEKRLSALICFSKHILYVSATGHDYILGMDASLSLSLSSLAKGFWRALGASFFYTAFSSLLKSLKNSRQEQPSSFLILKNSTLHVLNAFYTCMLYNETVQKQGLSSLPLIAEILSCCFPCPEDGLILQFQPTLSDLTLAPKSFQDTILSSLLIRENMMATNDPNSTNMSFQPPNASSINSNLDQDGFLFHICVQSIKVVFSSVTKSQEKPCNHNHSRDRSHDHAHANCSHSSFSKANRLAMSSLANTMNSVISVLHNSIVNLLPSLCESVKPNVSFLHDEFPSSKYIASSIEGLNSFCWVFNECFSPFFSPDPSIRMYSQEESVTLALAIYSFWELLLSDISLPIRLWVEATHDLICNLTSFSSYPTSEFTSFSTSTSTSVSANEPYFPIEGSEGSPSPKPMLPPPLPIFLTRLGVLICQLARPIFVTLGINQEKHQSPINYPDFPQVFGDVITFKRAETDDPKSSGTNHMTDSPTTYSNVEKYRYYRNPLFSKKASGDLYRVPLDSKDDEDHETNSLLNDKSPILCSVLPTSIPILLRDVTLLMTQSLHALSATQNVDYFGISSICLLIFGQRWLSTPSNALLQISATVSRARDLRRDSSTMPKLHIQQPILIGAETRPSTRALIRAFILRLSIESQIEMESILPRLLDSDLIFCKPKVAAFEYSKKALETVRAKIAQEQAKTDREKDVPEVLKEKYKKDRAERGITMDDDSNSETERTRPTGGFRDITISSILNEMSSIRPDESDQLFHASADISENGCDDIKLERQSSPLSSYSSPLAAFFTELSNIDKDLQFMTKLPTGQTLNSSLYITRDERRGCVEAFSLRKVFFSLIQECTRMQVALLRCILYDTMPMNLIDDELARIEEIEYQNMDTVDTTNGMDANNIGTFLTLREKSAYFVPSYDTSFAVLITPLPLTLSHTWKQSHLPLTLPLPLSLREAASFYVDTIRNDLRILVKASEEVLKCSAMYARHANTMSTEVISASHTSSSSTHIMPALLDVKEISRFLAILKQFSPLMDEVLPSSREEYRVAMMNLTGVVFSTAALHAKREEPSASLTKEESTFTTSFPGSVSVQSYPVNAVNVEVLSDSTETENASRFEHDVTMSAAESLLPGGSDTEFATNIESAKEMKKQDEYVEALQAAYHNFVVQKIIFDTDLRKVDDGV